MQNGFFCDTFWEECTQSVHDLLHKAKRMSSTIEELIATIVFLGGESSDVHKCAIKAVNQAAELMDSGMEESNIIGFLHHKLEKVTHLIRWEMRYQTVLKEFSNIKMEPAVKFNETVEVLEFNTTQPVSTLMG